MGHPTRDRVTVDLRSLREPLETLAATRQLTTAALVRQALVAHLGQQPEEAVPHDLPAVMDRDTHLVKVTLRLSSAHALLMSYRASKADVSQGAYVAALIDGAPPPLNPAQTVAALRASTDQLAVIGTDLSAFLRVMRTVKPGASQELERYRNGITTLNEDIRRHLTVAAQLVAELQASRRAR